MLFHIMDQRALKEGDGPIALICAPTRELAQQIEKECKRFGKPFGINCVCAYGGGSKWDQCNAVKEGCEVREEDHLVNRLSTADLSATSMLYRLFYIFVIGVGLHSGSTD